MAPLKFILVAALAATVQLVSGAQDDGCTYLTDCAGSVQIAVGGTCTSSYGADGKRTATVSGIKADACLQCPGTGTIDLNTFPYFVCNGKPICGNVNVMGTAKDILPNQAKCIWLDPNNMLNCLNSCTPNAPAPTTAPATTGPAPAPSEGPSSSTPSETPSKTPTESPSDNYPTDAPSGDYPTEAPSSSTPTDAPSSSTPSDSPSSSTPSQAPSSSAPAPPSSGGDKCGPGELPVSVEAGQTGCAAVPICVGGFPNGNCPAGSHCGIVKSGVPGCKLGAGSGSGSGSSTTAPSTTPSGSPSSSAPGPSSAPSSSTPSTSPSTSAPAYKCTPTQATPSDQCGGKIVLSETTPTGCATETFKVGSQTGCIQCSETLKVDANDANQCFAYCGSKPLCGSVSSFNLTPKQMLCIIQNPNSPMTCVM